MSLLWFSMFASNGYKMRYVALPNYQNRYAVIPIVSNTKPTETYFQDFLGHYILPWIASIHDSSLIQSRIEKTIDGELITQTQ